MSSTAYPGDENTYDPLSMDEPGDWSRVTHIIGGNVDIDGRCELAEWIHPEYGMVTVLRNDKKREERGIFNVLVNGVAISDNQSRNEAYSTVENYLCENA